MKETLARKPYDFEKLRSPTNAASDWRGPGSVDYLALETSIKPGMLCLRTSQIWFHLICGRRLQMRWTDVYLNTGSPSALFVGSGFRGHLVGIY